MSNADNISKPYNSSTPPGIDPTTNETCIARVSTSPSPHNVELLITPQSSSDAWGYMVNLDLYYSSNYTYLYKTNSTNGREMVCITAPYISKSPIFLNLLLTDAGVSQPNSWKLIAITSPCGQTTESPLRVLLREHLRPAAHHMASRWQSRGHYHRLLLGRLLHREQKGCSGWARPLFFYSLPLCFCCWYSERTCSIIDRLQIWQLRLWEVTYQTVAESSNDFRSSWQSGGKWQSLSVSENAFPGYFSW